MTMNIKERYWAYSLIVLIVVLGLLLAYEFIAFLGGFLGAFTVYILVRKQMHYLVEKKKWNKMLAAVLIMLEVIIVFLIPASVGVMLVVKVAENLVQHLDGLETSLNNVLVFFNEKFDLDLLSKESLVRMSSYITAIAKTIVGEISTFLINAFVLLFVLYFMLISSRPMEKYFYELLPFNDSNKQFVAGRVKDLVMSNAIGIPLLAVIQGIIATIGFMIFGVPMPWLFGMLTCFATIIPLLGTGLVWFPLAVYLALTHDWKNAIGLAIYALVIISNVDNLFRFLLQKKMADVHPLVTVFGVVVGLSIFGFWGVIFGPVILSVFLMLVDIFKKEYLDKGTPNDVIQPEAILSAKEEKRVAD